jgi:hypothetical protein
VDGCHQEEISQLPLIDVVNEAVAGHQPAPYKAAIGRRMARRVTDWIIKAFVDGA